MSDNKINFSIDRSIDFANSVIGAVEESRLERMNKERRDANITRLISLASLIVSVAALIVSILHA